ncbi:VIT and VWA domain-containing protein [Lacinutrix neustonica]|uniref:VIT and VWA domain-containing protein n=1 Tax=Lacinutrix neustonica TaxID=2980107 RepID=A0A9E8SHE1_9FLAO|nr:VIT and VWA domain-containing protein [Lacinutrix neustonica]WAC02615.1 VIT and VWA domain-containing protein [Lacinutrix neustonica]
MKTILPITFLLFVLQSFSQEIPRISINDSTYLELTTLKVESEIVGNVATTSYTMRFYNATNRILEGELAFPLGQGQAVTSFSMDVNGTMRDAVIVEKELGRVAFESTIRQQIDPGLLEVTKGNNYKARVYPIPAKGFKELRIEFEQELFISNGNYIYEIPFNFKTPVDFELKIAIYGKTQKYKIIEGKHLDLKFTRTQGVHYSKVSKSEWLANQSLKIELPVSTTEHVITYSDYFNLYKVIDPKTRLKQKPKHITVLWDASCSMQYRNLEAEMKLLDNYFNYLHTLTVDFISFSNSVETLKTFIVKDGNWNALKKQMKTIVYDGGTSYANLNLSRLKTNEILFFTDGMFNLGDLETNIQTPIYTINAVNAANHTFLENKATEWSGKYINLRITDVEQAFEALKYDAYQFLGIVENNLVSDIYPKTRVNVNSEFSIAGKFKEATQIELLFGYGNTITEKILVKIDKRLRNKLAKRLWAKKKLRYLSKNKEDNKNAIIELAKKNHLITAFTSMIILDRLEDYVRYKIEPPKALRQDFKQRMENSVEDEVAKLEAIKKKRVALLEDYKCVMNWYNTDYPIVLRDTYNRYYNSCN